MPAKKKQKKRKKAKAKRKAFVVSIIGGPDTRERRHANEVLRKIIRPALETAQVKYEAKRIDERGEAGSITEAVINALLEVPLVVVDLTGFNSNVLYEMGIRQAWNLPVIPIIIDSELSNLPFDLKDIATVPYNLGSQRAINSAITGIRKQLRSIIRGEQGDTVFHKAISEIGKKYSMDSLYEAFRDALSDMYQSLEDCKRELSNNDTWEDGGVLKDIADRIRDVFRTMADKTYVFRKIAKGRIYEPESSDSFMASLLEQVESLQRGRDKIISTLLSAVVIVSKGKASKHLADKKIKVLSEIAKSMEQTENIAVRSRTRQS